MGHSFVSANREKNITAPLSPVIACLIASKIDRYVGLPMVQNVNYRVCVKLWLLIGRPLLWCMWYICHLLKSTMSNDAYTSIHQFSTVVYWLRLITTVSYITCYHSISIDWLASANYSSLFVCVLLLMKSAQQRIRNKLLDKHRIQTIHYF